MDEYNKIMEMSNPLAIDKDRKEKIEEKKAEKNVKMSEDNRMMSMLVNKMKEMETEFDATEHMVIDLGNAITKIGFSGEDLPRLRIPSVWAESNVDNDKKNEFSFELKPHLFGLDALRNKNKDSYTLNFLKPGDHKNLLDAEFKDFLKETIEHQLSISPNDFKVIVNTPPIRNSENISNLSKMLIEDLGFKALAIVNSSSLALFSTGRTSGLVVDCGEARSYIVPVYEGFPLYHALNKNKIGGRDITNILSEGILENGIDLRGDILNLRKIKEKTCHVPHFKKFEEYLKGDDPIPPEKRLFKITQTDILPEKRSYKLPDEQTIIEVPKVSRLIASELLFSPEIVGRSERGLINLIADSISKTSFDNDDLKKIMTNNIVLAGGTTMIPGFSQRIKSALPFHLKNEMMINTHSPFQVVAEGNRDISTWIGASMIASMSSFDKIFLRREDYHESGEDRVSLFSKIF